MTERPTFPTCLAWHLDKDLPHPIAHIHMQAFAANRNLLSAFGIRPVIMLRNVPDMLTSFWDMLDTDADARRDGLNCVVPEDFTSFSDAQKADFMVDIIAPWYASYFASWKSFCDEAPGSRFASCATTDSAARRTNPSTPPSPMPALSCRAPPAAKRWRAPGPSAKIFGYNKGTEGRGRTYFSPRHLAEISRKLLLSAARRLDAGTDGRRGAIAASFLR